jgi:hypothetical protein
VDIPVDIIIVFPVFAAFINRSRSLSNEHI